MSDINLLPLHEREKELQELKRKMAEKSQIKIELSSPDQKPYSKEKWSGFFAGLKKYFKDLFSLIKIKRQAENKILPVKKSVLEKEPLMPAHKDDHLKHIAPQKFFYQVGQHSRPNDLSAVHQPLSPVQASKQINTEKVSPVLKIIPTIPAIKIIKSTADHKIDIDEPKPDVIKENQPMENLNQVEKMVINLIPSSIRKLAREQLKIKILAIALVVCLITSGVVYFILNQIASHKEALFHQLENEIALTEAGIKELQAGSQEIHDFSVLLQTVKNLLDKHIISTNIFKFLEIQTLPDVAYNSLSLDPALISVGLKASARNYQNLAEQILIFQNLSEVESVEIDSIMLKKSEETEDKLKKPELVTFNLTLKFKTDFFLIQP